MALCVTPWVKVCLCSTHACAVLKRQKAAPQMIFYIKTSRAVTYLSTKALLCAVTSATDMKLLISYFSGSWKGLSEPTTLTQISRSSLTLQCC